MSREDDIARVMEQMPEDWRFRWCTGMGLCACMGCFNNSGQQYFHRANIEAPRYTEWFRWLSILQGETTLKSCPFCGAEAETHLERDTLSDGEFGLAFVQCPQCRCRGPASREVNQGPAFKVKAKLAWNKRPAPLTEAEIRTRAANWSFNDMDCSLTDAIVNLCRERGVLPPE